MCNHDEKKPGKERNEIRRLILAVAIFIITIITTVLSVILIPGKPLAIDTAPVVSVKDASEKTVKPDQAECKTFVHEERRIMKVSAYTKNDAGMDGRGITSSGKPVQEGVTIAAPQDIPFGAKLYIPELGKIYEVMDRGGAIQGNRLDLYIESRQEALEFGVKELEVYIQYGAIP